MEHSAAAAALRAFVGQADARFHGLAQDLGRWVLAGPRPWAAVEQHTLAAGKGVGRPVLAGACQLAVVGAPPPPTTRCGCGRPAGYQRPRPAQVRTVLGPMTIRRACYHCTACRRGVAPADRRPGYRAGSTRAGLAEGFALLGATTDSSAAAGALLEKRTGVQLCPNGGRATTAPPGQGRQAQDQAVVPAAWAQGTAPPASATPTRRYLAMDGGLVHTAAPWREYTLGRVYTTTTRPSTAHPGRDDVCARAISSIGAAARGPHRKCASSRMGRTGSGPSRTGTSRGRPDRRSVPCQPLPLGGRPRPLRGGDAARHALGHAPRGPAVGRPGPESPPRPEQSASA